jgi:hypothetical protein
MIGSTPEATAKTEKRWLKVLHTLNEFQARLFVADKALDLGRGGIRWLSQLTGMSRTTITKAVQELHREKKLRVPPEGGARRPGGGRKKLEQTDPRLQQDLRRIVEESTAGDPMRLLRWTRKSTRTMAQELNRLGHSIHGSDHREGVPPAIVRRPKCRQFSVKSLSAGAVERSESAIHRPIVKPEEVYDAGRRERVIESVMSSGEPQVTNVRTESFSHCGLIAPQQW